METIKLSAEQRLLLLSLLLAGVGRGGFDWGREATEAAEAAAEEEEEEEEEEER